MGENGVLVLPNQLYRDIYYIEDGSTVFLVEADRYFTDFQFHKQKILFHRASMQYYKEYLESNGIEAQYFETGNEDPLLQALETASSEVDRLIVTDPVDHRLSEDITMLAGKLPLEVDIKENPGFLTPLDWFSELFNDGHYLMSKFYTAQRKRLDILIEDEKPLGGKWSFDTENRRRFDETVEVPQLLDLTDNKFVKEAKNYVSDNFHKNPGDIEEFIYPVTHEDSLKWLDDFIENRLMFFGDYQDSIVRDKEFLFHSLLSPLLNSGLLIPDNVIDSVLDKHRKVDIPLNSLEGFIRQVIGWREFVRCVYILEGNKQRKSNFWEHSRSIPQSFYDGTTGIEPIDQVLSKLNRYAYAHHIERLMILGNFFLLTKRDPEEVYRWFMEMFIDSYDWVMVPNVFGMSQYADGGMMMTKPYISSSNYITKMSDYERDNWDSVWDALYWNFIHDNKEKISKIPRMSIMVNLLEKMDDEKLKSHLRLADEFIKGLDEI